MYLGPNKFCDCLWDRWTSGSILPNKSFLNCLNTFLGLWNKVTNLREVKALSYSFLQGVQGPLGAPLKYLINAHEPKPNPNKIGIFLSIRHAAN